jgi:hypothetical protein
MWPTTASFSGLDEECWKWAAGPMPAVMCIKLKIPIRRGCGLAGEDLRLLREQGAHPVLEKLHAYLIEARQQLLPRSEAGQAVNYILKNWAALTRYCESPDLAIDNNRTERSFARLGRGPQQLDVFRQ